MPLHIDFHIHFPLPLPTNIFIFLFFSISKSIYFYSDRAALEPSVRGGVGDRVQYIRPQKGHVFPVPLSIDQAGRRRNSIGVNRLGGIGERGVPMGQAMKSDSLSGVEELSTVEPCIILGYSLVWRLYGTSILHPGNNVQSMLCDVSWICVPGIWWLSFGGPESVAGQKLH